MCPAQPDLPGVARFLPRQRVGHYNAGRMIYDLATPSIEICAETFERNLRKLAGYVKKHGVGLRPHSKTHKSTFIGKKQMEAGAIGRTVAKAGGAAGMAERRGDRLIGDT